MQLVFSDEFEQEGRSFGVEAKDSRWTAENMWYEGTLDFENYRSEQINTTGGAAVIKLEKKESWAYVQRFNGEVWNVTKNYTSGFMSTWNKFCFTGGYIEAGLWFPGDDYISGFWPAFWMMGNLARPGYMMSTSGMWPYSYNSCGGDLSGSEKEGANKPQKITACPDPSGFNRTLYGLLPGQGRGAPEIDMVEMKVPPSIDESTGQPIALGLQRGGEPGQHPAAFNSMTLQAAPLLPNGTTWMSVNNTDSHGPLGPGMYLNQAPMQPGGALEGMYTHSTYWTGEFAYGMVPQLREAQSRLGFDEGNFQNMLMNIRPGNLVQDALSVMATLTPNFYQAYHKFGVDWKPNEYVRWYIDGQLVYEVNKEALRAQGNGTYETFERLIPVEPMMVILNFAISDGFTKVDFDRLGFPAEYKVDYVRVYQEPDAVNLGCSPPDYPTAQYLACNRDTYVMTKEDDVLIPDVCEKLPYCKSQVNVEFQGGDLLGTDGQPVKYTNISTSQECCQMCAKNPACGAWVWNPRYDFVCIFKNSSGYNATAVTDPNFQGLLSGVVYNAGSSTPRVTTGGRPTGRK